MADTETAPAAPATPKAAARLFDVFDRHRYRELDGLRGLASMMVGINHALGAVIKLRAHTAGWTVIAGLAGVVSGAIAVDLFFIMSGFFLAGMLESAGAGRLAPFYARRLIRLVPPAVAAVLVIYLYARFSLAAPPAYPGVADDYRQFYSDNHALSHRDLLLNLLLVRHTLNPVLWTIRIEIGVSLIFPLLFFIKNIRPDFWFRTALLPLLLAVAVLLRNDQKLGVDVLHYLYIFYAGVWARDFGRAVRLLGATLQYALLAACLLGLALTGLFDPTYGAHPILYDVPVTVFGTGLIVLLAYGEVARARGFLKSMVVQFLGRVSYSVYLLDWLAVRCVGGGVLSLGIASRYGDLTAVLMVVLGSVLVSLAFGYALHVAVEAPAVAVSRYLGRRPAALPTLGAAA